MPSVSLPKMKSQLFNTPGTATWLCPQGVTQIVAVGHGAGGGGGSARTASAGAGSGYGGFGVQSYAQVLTVVPGTLYNINVAAGAGAESTGASTTIDDGVTTIGTWQGGSPGGHGVIAVVNPGNLTTGFGFPGGAYSASGPGFVGFKGEDSSFASGGSGGSNAQSGGPGGGGAGDGAGGDGGVGNGAAGQPGTDGGGGGGGCTPNGAGGAGGDGKMVLYWMAIK